MKKKLHFYFLFVFAFILLSSQAFPQDSLYQTLTQKAGEAIASNNISECDFYLARLLALVTKKKLTQSLDDLKPLMKKRKLSPKAVLPSGFDESFLEWFVKDCNERWDVSEQNIKAAIGAVELFSVSKDKYFLTVSAYPEIQSWFVENKDLSSKLLWLAVGSSKNKKKVFLMGGKNIAKISKTFKAINLDTGLRAVLNILTPELFDLDNDGVPEIWIRYNLAADNGFTQVLSIYKIIDDETIEPFKEFRAEYEGVARRIEGNQVEIITHFGSKKDFTHRDFDRARIKTFDYKNGDFIEASSQETAHILKNKDWKKFY